MTYIRPHDDEASEMFTDSVDTRGGGPQVHCQCNIDHYAVESRYFYPEDSIPKEGANVKHHHGCDGIGHGIFNNRVFVDECEGCSKQLRRYEDFIWNERDTIRNYLKTRIEQEKKWADQEHIKNILCGIS